MSRHVMALIAQKFKRFYSYFYYTHTHSRHYFFILPVVVVGRLPSLSLSLLFEYFALPNIDYLAKDLTLFGKLEFGGAMKPTDDGIPVLTDRVGALEIHNKILY